MTRGCRAAIAGLACLYCWERRPPDETFHRVAARRSRSLKLDLIVLAAPEKYGLEHAPAARVRRRALAGRVALEKL
jgi:hypothetical protein